MKLILGLGNPGDDYAATRHNLGAMILDALAVKLGERLTDQPTLHAAVAKHGQLVLAKPLTFMNNSGQPAHALTRWFKIALSDLVVVHDDLDVPLGEAHLKLGGGTAGHNGVASVAYHLGSPEFWRVRVGIGPTDETLQTFRTRDTAGFVLAPFTADEASVVRQVIDMVCSTLESTTVWEPATLRVRR